MDRDIKVYDFEFNLLMVLGQYKSIHWDIYYNKIGMMELHLDLNSPLLPVLMKNDYLIIRQGGKKTAIVTSRLIDTEIVINGRTCSWILTRRTTPDFKPKTGTAEDICRGIVSEAFSDVDNFVLGERCGDSEEISFWRNTRNPAFDVISECLAKRGAGHEVSFDTKNRQWVFSVLLGKELDIILSESNKNAYETQISGDCLDYYTCGYYEKQTEPDADAAADNTEVQSEWIYVEGDSEKKGIYRWEAVLSGSEEWDAKQNLKEKKKKAETSCKARGIVWGRDYELGDIMRLQTVKGSWRETVKKRIGGVSVWFEKGASGNGEDYGESPVLEDI